MIYALTRRPDLVIEDAAGTNIAYIAFNSQDPVLRDTRVRQAIAYAMNRPLIIHTLWRDRARVADSLLPAQHWAWTGDVQSYPHAPEKANALLDSAGYVRNAQGVRFHLAMKTSTDEGSRLLAVVLQQQLREVGIALDVRSFEFATFYGDISKGAFQMYTLRWIGGNEDPQIFRYAFDSDRFPPHGANRGRYVNHELDSLIQDAGTASDQAQRRKDYVRVQQILATELPAINLWYLDQVLVHRKRLGNLHVSSSGDFDFLRQATVAD
jgi:peptide/nickel transport system substrate-binding protein